MQLIKNTIRDTLRSIGFIVLKPKGPKQIKELKKDFQHNERSFVYGCIKHLVDCLYCHASPGVIETITLNLIEKKGSLTSNKLLNIGGGTGQVSSIYRSIGFDVYNIDIEITSENEHNLKFDLNQNLDLPFPNDSFNVVLCQEIIEHIENPWKLLRDARRILKNDGLVIISTPNILSLQSRLMFLFKGYFKWFSPDCLTYHINPLPVWEIELIAQKVGLKLESIQGSGDYFFNKDNKNRRKILRNNEALILTFKK